jgi:hypothetical protein
VNLYLLHYIDLWRGSKLGAPYPIDFTCSLSSGLGGEFGRGMRLTTHLLLVPSVRMKIGRRYSTECLNGMHKDNCTFYGISSYTTAFTGVTLPESLQSSPHCYDRLEAQSAAKKAAGEPSSERPFSDEVGNSSPPPHPHPLIFMILLLVKEW